MKSADVLVVMAGLFAAAVGLPTLGGASTESASVSPAQLVQTVPKGKLTNPYKDTQADIVAQGGKLFQSYSCSGCHGGGGGGGMGPAVTNDIWIYGGDDDTLFRLVALGSDGLQKEGYKRVGARKRGRADAAVRHDHQDCRRSLEDAGVHSLQIQR